MTPNKPYLLRALYEWICDNGMTPHLMVAADYPEVQVPLSYVQDGRIVLNIAPRAVSSFAASNDVIEFSARFSGQPFAISVPVDAVLGIYARENGQGMFFEIATPPEGGPPESGDDKPKPISHLKVVK